MSVTRILDQQEGVVSRRQVVEVGDTDSDIRRRLARREWASVYPGVYVNHTGPLTWLQAAWAAVLYYWPAFLAGPSALHAAGVRGFDPQPGAPIYVCVDRMRTVRRRVGITVHQIARVDGLCQAASSPPRQRVEHALLDVASRKKRLDGSIAVLADAVQARYTTPDRLLAALNERPKLRHRALLRSVLADVQQGVGSVLEYRYLKSVERAHGLPTGLRQSRSQHRGKVGYADVDYQEYGVRVELDGKLAHDRAADRWADLGNDLAALVESTLTLRAGWAQVLDACRLASLVGEILQRRGWKGRLRPCGPKCTANSSPGREEAVQMR